MSVEQAVDETQNDDVELNDELDSNLETEVEDEEESEPLNVSLDEDEEESPTSEENADEAPEWVKNLRKSDKQKSKEIRELRAKLEQVTPKEQAQAVKTLGAKPTLADAGIDYDEDAYSAAMDKWYSDKREIEAAEEAKKAAQAEQAKAQEAKQAAYKEQIAKLKAPDYQDAEDEVVDKFSAEQQGIVLAGAENPALLVLALGKSPKKLAELAAIKDLAKFTFAVAKIEKDLLEKNRMSGKPKPKPSADLPRSSAPLSQGRTDKKLEQLEKEAEKTGDRSKVIAYKKSLAK